MSRKVAFITGGASGMGLAVATALCCRDWVLHLIDLNKEAGEKAASSLRNAYFHQCNVTSYSSLVSAFEAVFQQSGRIDFVYANAGIVEKDNFYEDHDLSQPPPEPNQLSIDINLKAVVNTSYLARHYFRKNPKDAGINPALVMTASCGGLYPSEFCPMYSGAKAGVIHFNRAIAYRYHQDGIRTYATAPGTIVTNLLAQDDWKAFPEQYFTPMETLVHAVLKLIDGGDMEDAKGRKIAEKDAWGLCVEVNGKNFYFRDQAEYCDKNMEEMMKYTSMEHQLKRLEKEKAKQQQA